MKVFFDTNIWFSATLFPGLCAELLLRCVEEGHAVLTSPLIRIEAVAVLADKFPRHPEAPVLFDANWSVAQVMADVSEPQDDKDALPVAVAAAAGADLFVLVDSRVHSWERAGNTRIVSPRQA